MGVSAGKAKGLPEADWYPSLKGEGDLSGVPAQPPPGGGQGHATLSSPASRSAAAATWMTSKSGTYLIWFVMFARVRRAPMAVALILSKRHRL